MSTEIKFTKSTVSITLDPKKKNKKIRNGVYNLLDIDAINANHIDLAIETITGSGKRGIRVTNHGILPIASNESYFSILYSGYQGTAPAVLQWTEVPIGFDANGNFSLLIDAAPLSFYNVKLRIYDAGSIKDFTPKTITTPDDGTYVNVGEILSEDVFTPDKKRTIKGTLSILFEEQATFDAQADSAEVSHTTYDATIVALKAKLASYASWDGTALDWKEYASNTNLGVGEAALLQEKIVDVNTARGALITALAADAKDAGQYADTIIRSGYNLIKNGNSEMGATATSFEANGLVNDPTNAFAGSWCRKVRYANDLVLFTDRIPCTPGEEYYIEAKAKLVGGTGQANLFAVMGSGTTASNYNGVSFSNGTYQDISFSTTIPEGCTWIQFYSDCVNMTAGSAYFDNLYACKKITAGMLQADMAITNIIRSPNYTAGTVGNAPVGFKISGNTFQTTLKDGTTFDTNMEIGAFANIGGYKVGDVVGSVFNRSVEFTTPGTYTWVCPPGLFYVELTLIAGGGGGAYGGNSKSGGGGGGGESLRMIYPVVPGETYTIFVGAGGVGGTATSTYYCGTAGGLSGIQGPDPVHPKAVQVYGGQPAGYGATTSYYGGDAGYTKDGETQVLGSKTAGGAGGNGLSSPGLYYAFSNSGAGGGAGNTSTTKGGNGGNCGGYGGGAGQNTGGGGGGGASAKGCGGHGGATGYPGESPTDADDYGAGGGGGSVGQNGGAGCGGWCLLRW